MKRRLAAALLLALPLAHPSLSLAQARAPSADFGSRTFYIRGTVRNSDDARALEMIKVDLRRFTGETIGVTFTRSNGEYEFNGIPNGIYYIIVEEKDYEPVRQSVELTTSSRTGIVIFLKRPLEIRTTDQGRVVSTRELSIPRKAHDAMQKGMGLLYEKNDFKGSLPLFQRAVAELPSYYEAYHQMGMAYLRMGQPNEAEQAFRKAISLSEEHYADPFFGLAGLLSNLQRFTEATTLAGKGIDLAPNAWEGHFEMARAMVGLNRLDEAEKSAIVARTRKADFPSLHLILANIHIRKKNYVSLLEDLEAYLRLEPNGSFSEQARLTRDRIQRAMANAQNRPPAEAPKP